MRTRSSVATTDTTSTINTLNHYIGMRKLDQRAFADLDFLPFFIGVLALLTLRVALIGDVRALLTFDRLVTLRRDFAFGRLVYQLYLYGHDSSKKRP